MMNPVPIVSGGYKKCTLIDMGGCCCCCASKGLELNSSPPFYHVLQLALGSVEIFLSRHCPLWYGFGGDRLKWLQRLAYINTTVYPFMSLPLVAYYSLSAICLLTGKFIIPTLSNLASVWFLGLFLSIIVTSVLELWWSGVSIEYLWRNEQFWVIGGLSAYLFAIFQRFLKMLAGLDTNFIVTAKAADDAEFGELYIFKWTTVWGFVDFSVSLGLPCDVKRAVSQDLRGLPVLRKRSVVVFDDMG